MRSRRNAFALGVVVAAIAACGTDVKHSSSTPDAGMQADSGYVQMPCDQSFLTYDNFGKPFMENWCTGCHSKSIPGDANLCSMGMPDMRQCAPVGIDFDTQADVQNYKDMIAAHSTGDMTMVAKPMPPAGGPQQTDRDQLAEWLTCGVR